ncbi:T-complex protein 1 subunit eta, partial [Erysiphe pulchra]
MEDHLREDGAAVQVWREGGALEAAYWRSCDTVLRRQGPRVPGDRRERAVDLLRHPGQAPRNLRDFRGEANGGERFNFFEGCSTAKTCTLVLRGGAEQFIAEVERSLHDAIMIVKRAIKNQTIVAGGGACEMEVSAYLHNFADKNVAT